jgi:hypothetical protein
VVVDTTDAEVIDLINDDPGTKLIYSKWKFYKKLESARPPSRPVILLLYLTLQSKMSAEASSSTSNAHASVLMPSEELPEDAVHIKGPDMSNPITLDDLLKAYNTIGFQATGLARAIQIVEEMVNGILSLRLIDADE